MNVEWPRSGEGAESVFDPANSVSVSRLSPHSVAATIRLLTTYVSTSIGGPVPRIQCETLCGVQILIIWADERALVRGH